MSLPLPRQGLMTAKNDSQTVKNDTFRPFNPLRDKHLTNLYLYMGPALDIWPFDMGLRSFLAFWPCQVLVFQCLFLTLPMCQACQRVRMSPDLYIEASPYSHVRPHVKNGNVT